MNLQEEQQTLDQNINYEQLQKNWKGNSGFCCGGRIMMGDKQQQPAVYGTLLAFFGASLYFFCITGVYLWVNYSYWPNVIGVILMVPALYNFLLSAYSDPGVLIRGNIEQPDADKPRDSAQIIDQLSKIQINSNNFNGHQNPIIEMKQIQVSSSLNSNKINNDNNNNEYNIQQNHQNDQLKNNIEEQNQVQNSSFTNVGEPNLQLTLPTQQLQQKQQLLLNPEQQQYQINNQNYSNGQQLNNHIQIQINDESKHLPQKDFSNNPVQLQENQVINLYTERYCKTCKIMRPPKASHCSQCDQCVLGFDHHCSYIDNCVGIRNWKNFIGFTFFISIYDCWFCGWSIYASIQQSLRFQSIFEKTFQNIIILCVCGFFLMCTVCCSCNRGQQQQRAMAFFFFLVSLLISTIVIDSQIDGMKFYDNPFISIIGALIQFQVFIMTFPIFCLNIFYASSGKTAKEFNAYYKARQANSLYQIGIWDRIANLYRFCTYKIPKSNILHQTC